MTITQFFLFIFLFFALSRVFLRFRGGTLHLIGFLFWSAVFGSAIVLVLIPGVSSSVAAILGIGRGADVVIYISIALLFYLVFRIYIFLEGIRHDITELVQRISLKEDQEKHDE